MARPAFIVIDGEEVVCDDVGITKFELMHSCEMQRAILTFDPLERAGLKSASAAARKSE